MDNIDAQGLGTMKVPDTSSQLRPPVIPRVNTSDFQQDFYNMNHSKRGIAVIINNKKFKDMQDRKGTDIDAEAMYALFDTLGFESILRHDDVTAKNMKELMAKASQYDYTDSDCFACAILTHGEDGVLHGTDGKIAIEDLVKPFKGDQCKSLAGKPKLFFIQACRGRRFDGGTTVSDAAGHETEDIVDVFRIPTEADFLMAYSVVPGYYAWRNEANGSCFIQAVVNIFTKNWQTMDVVTMMTRVNKKVAFDFESKNSDVCISKMKQVPCLTSMLTKDVFFKK